MPDTPKMYELRIRASKEGESIFQDLNLYLLSEEQIPTTINQENLDINISNQECTINIYPNPVKDIIHISDGERAEIYSLTGQKFLDKEIKNNYINVSELTKGFYLLKIYKDNNISTIKIYKE